MVHSPQSVGTAARRTKWVEEAWVSVTMVEWFGPISQLPQQASTTTCISVRVVYLTHRPQLFPLRALPGPHPPESQGREVRMGHLCPWELFQGTLASSCNEQKRLRALVTPHNLSSSTPLIIILPSQAQHLNNVGQPALPVRIGFPRE